MTFLISDLSTPGSAIRQCRTRKQMFAGDEQVMAQQQVIILVNAACQRIFNGDQGDFASPRK